MVMLKNAYLFILRWQDSLSYSVTVDLIFVKKYLNSRLLRFVFAHHTDTAHTRSPQLQLETISDSFGRLFF